MSPTKQSTRYCFTWNNPDNGTVPFLEAFSTTNCKYLVYGNEVSSTGTPHLQGFFTLPKQLSIVALKRHGMQCHLEATKGTSLQASEYCKKDGDFVEFGTPPRPGKRTDIQAACDAIKDGTPISTIAEEHSDVYVKYGRGLRDLALVIQKPYDHDTVRGLWIYGPPGTGKSHCARSIGPNAYLKSQSKWFDGYNNQRIIILDDMDTNVLGHHLKIWSDKYACTGETKGGTIHLQHHLFIVTSNYAPSHLWIEDPPMLSAIERRFKIVHKTTRNQLIDHVALNE